MWTNADGDCQAAWVSLLGVERLVYEVAMPFLGYLALTVETRLTDSNWSLGFLGVFSKSGIGIAAAN
jgi:hypothetical protein